MRITRLSYRSRTPADRTNEVLHRQKTENQLGESEQFAEKQTKLVEELSKKVRLDSKLFLRHALNSSIGGFTGRRAYTISDRSYSTKRSDGRVQACE